MELLVWANDKHLDLADVGTAVDTGSYKQGDVITVQPDGWGWTQTEQTNPDWVIIKAPILQTMADTLLSNAATGVVNPKSLGVIPLRSWKIDFTLVPVAIVGGTAISLTNAQMQAAVVQKQAVVT